MSLEDREAIVSTVQETYGLMGRALSTDIPSQLLETAIRQDVMQQLKAAKLDPSVSDEEMLGLLRTAYFELIDAVLRIQEQLLGNSGESYEGPLAQVQLTGSGQRVKVTGFRHALGRVFSGLAGGVRKAFGWGNIVLGSLGSVPGVGVFADSIRELKESVEAQFDAEQP